MITTDDSSTFPPLFASSDTLAWWEQLLIFIAGDALCLSKHCENIRSGIKREGVWDKQHIAGVEAREGWKREMTGKGQWLLIIVSLSLWLLFIVSCAWKNEWNASLLIMEPFWVRRIISHHSAVICQSESPGAIIDLGSKIIFHAYERKQ